MAIVTIKRYRDLSEAIVARSLLQSAGIVVVLCDENLVRLDWQISNFIGGIRLQVNSEDEQEAREIIDSPVPDAIDYEGDAGSYPQPLCPRCGSTNLSFQGASRKAALISLYILSVPLPLGPRTWICGSCGNRWEAVE
jgi:Putative prokaryotic signal transducing protein